MLLYIRGYQITNFIPIRMGILKNIIYCVSSNEYRRLGGDGEGGHSGYISTKIGLNHSSYFVFEIYWTLSEPNWYLLTPTINLVKTNLTQKHSSICKEKKFTYFFLDNNTSTLFINCKRNTFLSKNNYGYFERIICCIFFQRVKETIFTFKFYLFN